MCQLIPVKQYCILSAHTLVLSFCSWCDVSLWLLLQVRDELNNSSNMSYIVWSVLPGMRPMTPMAGPPMGAPMMPPARPMGATPPARMPSKWLAYRHLDKFREIIYICHWLLLITIDKVQWCHQILYLCSQVQIAML